MLSMTRGLLTLAALAAFSGSALASPIGTEYPVTVGNFGSATFAQTILYFDGVEEAVPGTSLSVNEMARDLPDGGELIEFWITSTLPFNESVMDPAGNSGIGFGPLQWLPLGTEGQSRANSAFFYFTRDGVPLNIQDQLGILGPRGVSFGPHPYWDSTDPAPTVAFFPNAAESPVIVGIDTAVFDDPATPEADAPYGLLELAFGLAGQLPDDLHFGIVIDHAVPEPSGALLLGLALGALGLTRRLH